MDLNVFQLRQGRSVRQSPLMLLSHALSRSALAAQVKRGATLHGFQYHSSGLRAPLLVESFWSQEMMQKSPVSFCLSSGTALDMDH